MMILFGDKMQFPNGMPYTADTAKDQQAERIGKVIAKTFGIKESKDSEKTTFTIELAAMDAGEFRKFKKELYDLVLIQGNEELKQLLKNYLL